jgi:hypothetical protein
VDLTDLWSWPDIPRFQKQSVFDLSGRRFNAPHDSRVSLGIESRDPDVPSCWHSHAPQLSSVNDLPYTN